MTWWNVKANRKVQKQVEKLPRNVKDALNVLLAAIRQEGPTRHEWPNYGRLGENIHHCHLKKGHPTYVAVWEVIDKKVKLIEVLYAGTHEKSPYQKH